MEYAYIKLWQKLLKGRNSFEPKHAAVSKTLEDGIIYKKEISYAKEYPNSFLDLYLSPKSGEEKLPTYIFVHGGGFCWGDKDDADADYQKRGNHSVLKAFVKEGFNVAVVNYALAPDYPYPTPVVQLNQAVAFLKENQAEYNLDMSRVLFGGGSAGGNIIGQFINIQTNADYAVRMRMKPVLDSTEIKGAIFNCALLDNERFEWIGRDKPFKMFKKCGEAYFHCKELKGNEMARESNVIAYISRDFPPTYITEANVDSFMEQAVELDKKLTELGIKHQLNMYAGEEAVLRHGYDEFGGKYADENLAKTLSFVKSIL